MFNMTNGKKHNVGRLMRVHSNDTEDITEAKAGDIVAVFGIDCASGTTFTDGKTNYNMTSMFVPNAVIDMKIDPLTIVSLLLTFQKLLTVSRKKTQHSVFV